TIEFDPKQPERSSIVVQIQVASIDTKIKKRDEHLRSADFFDAEKFPEIVFRSRSVKQTAADAGEISGELTMHGVTRPITLRVKVEPAKAAPAGTRWSVVTKPIQRKEFGLAFSPTAEAVSGVSEEVSPEIEIERS
ncbi:MAG: YceI family protein, partial [Chthoniobacterales bacterium]